MKILQVNCVYNTGSTGKIMSDIDEVLRQKGFESVICYGRGERVCVNNVYKTSAELAAKLNNLKSRFTGMPYAGSFFATNRLIKIIKREMPDVVHLHCINGFFVNIYKLVEFLKKNKIPTVMTMHAEFIYTGSCAHAYDCERWFSGCGSCPDIKQATNSYIFDRTAKAWKKMRKAFDGFSKARIVSVSKWVQSRAEKSPILAHCIHSTITNGIDCDFIPCRESVELLRKKHNINIDEKVILHVTANFLSEIKGGKYIIELAEKLKNDRIKIVLIGTTSELELPENIINVGRIGNRETLAEYYAMADLTVITSKKETFSMPVAESMCFGTPVVGFKAGGPESIALKEFSEFVEQGNIDELTNTVKQWINKKANMQDISEEAKKAYCKERMADDYIKIYLEVSDNK